MQGACNIDTVKLFLGTHKPAILALQEACITPDNKCTFYHKLYQAFITNDDLVTFVPKDIKAELALHPPLPFSAIVLKIQGEAGHQCICQGFTTYML